MADVIRVLQVVTHMNRGGLETMIMNYYRNIDRNTIQFDFLTHRPESEVKDYDDEINRLGGKIFHISRLNPFSIKYLRELEKFFLSHPEYKVIHVHQDCLSSVILKVAKKCGVRVRIAHCHSSNQDRNLYYPVKLFYKTKISESATKMISCGEESGKWMFGKKADFIVLPNAIDSSKYVFSNAIRKKKRKDLGFNDTDIVLGHVGRFSEVKNHAFIIEILKNLVQLNQNVKLVLVGTGELLQTIIEKVEEYNLSKYVLFLGLRDDVNELLQAFDMFIMPSLYEGLPVSIIEAQATGLKCIISDMVPIECNITGNVFQYSLSKSAEEWSRYLLEQFPYDRKDTKKAIIDAGFDIVDNALFLSKLYINSYDMI